jgi:hypothetical protein
MRFVFRVNLAVSRLGGDPIVQLRFLKGDSNKTVYH